MFFSGGGGSGPSVPNLDPRMVFLVMFASFLTSAVSGGNSYILNKYLIVNQLIGIAGLAHGLVAVF